jgi:hypothetical protein
MTREELEQGYLAYRAVTQELCELPWRQGRSQPRNIYAVDPDLVGDWSHDHMIGQFSTPELASEAVRAHNAAFSGV